ncbi:MAG: ion transporter [Firmicutes bacterium]|nr:ion transporter [[Eubacterium] siraeum]MCM1488777.1 ion transporter [Bacillota bacterium]
MSYCKIKKRVYELIDTAQKGDIASKAVDIFLICLIVLNVIMVIADTFTLKNSIKNVMTILETVSVVIFSAEYILRLWTANFIYPDRKPIWACFRYAVSFQALIDLISLLPFYLPFVFPVNLMILRTFRLFRLLRLIKVNRYTHALTTVITVFKNKAHQLISSTMIVLVLMIMSSVLIYNLEHEAQPDVFQNAFSGLWWSIATLTTVGYGDIYPITVGGKIFSAIIALLGIGMVAVPTGIITSGFSEQINKEQNSANVKQDDLLNEINEKAGCLDTLQRAKLLIYADKLTEDSEYPKMGK